MVDTFYFHFGKSSTDTQKVTLQPPVQAPGLETKDQPALHAPGPHTQTNPCHPARQTQLINTNSAIQRWEMREEPVNVCEDESCASRAMATSQRHSHRWGVVSWLMWAMFSVSIAPGDQKRYAATETRGCWRWVTRIYHWVQGNAIIWGHYGSTPPGMPYTLHSHYI